MPLLYPFNANYGDNGHRVRRLYLHKRVSQNVIMNNRLHEVM